MQRICEHIQHHEISSYLGNHSLSAPLPPPPPARACSNSREEAVIPGHSLRGHPTIPVESHGKKLPALHCLRINPLVCARDSVLYVLFRFFFRGGRVPAWLAGGPQRESKYDHHCAVIITEFERRLFCPKKKKKKRCVRLVTMGFVDKGGGGRRGGEERKKICIGRCSANIACLFGYWNRRGFSWLFGTVSRLGSK